MVSSSNRSPARTVVLLDTNFLFLPLQFGINLEREFERALPELHRLEVPRSVLRELGRLQEKEDRPRLVKFANSLVTTLIVSEYDDPGGAVDTSIVNEASARQAIIATNDKELIRKAKERGIRIARLYGKTRIRIDY